MRGMQRISVGLGCALLLMAAPSAVAGSVTLDDQTRSVSVVIPAITDLVLGGTDDSVNETLSATDFGVFDVDLDRTVNIVDPGEGFNQLSHARATQTSSFAADGLDLVLSAVGSSAYSSMGARGITSADSDFEVVFTLDSATGFAIQGSGSYIDTAGGASGFIARITDAGGPAVPDRQSRCAAAHHRRRSALLRRQGGRKVADAGRGCLAGADSSG